MDDASLLKLSASESIALIAGGTLSVERLAQAHLDRIAIRNEAVLAWAHLDPELVIREAKRLDAIPRERRGPLHGSLVGVKDIINTQDMPTQHNSPLFVDSFPAVDASVVAILRSCGALIFGKTTTTEFAAYRYISPTRNPHDPACTPGGSSSGSAAAVADYQIQIALGTQTAGSVIRPASFCGVLGFKPTWGTIGHDGVKLFSPTNDTLGFFTRSIDDLSLLAKIFWLSRELDTSPQPSLPLRIGFCETPWWKFAGPETREAMSRARIMLEKSGVIVEDFVLPPQFDNLFELHRIILSGEGKANFLAPYTLSTDMTAKEAIPPCNQATSCRPLLHPDLVSHVQNSTNISSASLLSAYDQVAALRPQFDSLASGFDAILAPSSVGSAPPFEATGDPQFCSGWTVLQVPVLGIPIDKIGGESGKMPVGLTLVGGRLRDSALLNAAANVIDAFYL